MEDIELRIGCVVKFNKATNNREKGEIGQFELSDFYSISEGGLDFDDIEPILLTEELLLSCGFIEDEAFAYLSDEEDSQYPVFKHNGFALLLKEGAFYVYEECEEDCWYNSYWHEIKYLHKLQNYVYETQDEELTINLI